MTGTANRLRGLIRRLEFSRGTHIEWAEWFEAHPKDTRIKDLGDAAFHREMEADYDKRITAITSAVDDIDNLLVGIREIQTYAGRHRRCYAGQPRGPLADIAVMAQTLLRRPA